MDPEPQHPAADATAAPQAEITSPPPAVPSFQTTMHSAFIGSDGLRAGWRFFLYIVLWRLVKSLIDKSLVPIDAHISRDILAEFIDETGRFIACTIPALIMARIEGRKFTDYGLPKRTAFGKLFWVGTIWGFAGITFLLLILRGTGAFYFGHLALHGTRILKFAGFWGAFYLIVGFYEEFLFRGYSLFTLSSGMRFWPSAILLSILFGGIHLFNPGENTIGIVAAGFIGLFLCLTLLRTGNLWFAVGFHAAWDWGESFFYSVPDSGTTDPGHLMNSTFHGSSWITGGSVGPEGSIFVYLTIILLWMLFARVYPDVKYQRESRAYHV
jgi:uncharacterized protein